MEKALSSFLQVKLLVENGKIIVLLIKEKFNIQMEKFIMDKLETWKNMEKAISSSLIIVSMLGSSRMDKLWVWEPTTSMTKLLAKVTGSMENYKKL